MKIALFICIGFLCSGASYSQIVNSVIKKLEETNQIDYQVKIWNIKPGTTDTSFFLKQNHHVSFNKADSLINAYFNIDDDRRTYIYHGPEYISADKVKGIATVVNLHEIPEWNKNVFYNFSYIEILKILKLAENDKGLQLTESRNKIRISAPNKAYYGKLVDMNGVNTEFEIGLFRNSYYPEYMTIRCIKEGKNIFNEGRIFSGLEISNTCKSDYYSQQFINQSMVIVDHKNSHNLKIGDIMPNWVVYRPNTTEKILLRELNRDKLLLIEFWFTACQYCIKSIPTLNALHNKFKDKGLEIVYANGLMSDTDEKIEDFRKDHEILFTVYRFGNIYELGPFPTFVLVDKKGIIRYKVDGYPDDLAGDVESLMKTYGN